MIEPKRILVFQAGKLGDVICMTPVFRAIKMRYPSSFLVVTVDSLTKDVLGGNPYIDNFILRKDLSLKSIKDLDLDVGILLGSSQEVLLNLLLARVKTIIVPKIVEGYSPYPTKLFRLLSIFVTKVQHRMGHYAPGEYLNMLKPLGISSQDTKKDIYIINKNHNKIDKLLDKSQKFKLLGIAPGAGNRIKEWPPEKFADLAGILISKYGVKIVLIGSDKDKQLADIIKSRLPEESVIDTTGSISIDELKYLINNLDLFISADTGPIYIAEALGIPTVDIVGPVDEREQPPIGEKHLVVLPPDRKRPELYVMNARVYNHAEATRLAASTRVEDVFGAVEKLLK